MVRPIDLTGETYGKLTVVQALGARKAKSFFLCTCECGATCEVSGNNLKSGNTTSCGCHRTALQHEPRSARVGLTCPTCGTKFERTARQVEARSARFCSKGCAAAWFKANGVGAGENNPAWTGGRRRHPQGYILVRHDGRYVLEHRLVMARHLGRELTEEEQVHHKNEDKTDNRIENLELTNASDHRRLHPLKTWSRHGHEACVECGSADREHEGRGLCTLCFERERFRLHGRRSRKTTTTA